MEKREERGDGDNSIAERQKRAEKENTNEILSS